MPYREPTTQRVVYLLGESGSGFKPRSLSGAKDINKIKETCRKQPGLMFEDEEFPANDASIGTKDAAEYTWKRPFEIVPKGKAPEFIVDGANRFDIRQGNIGNCWLLAAIADLTLNKTVLEFTLTSDNSFTKKYCGAFHFRFWQYGKWIDVVIDDRLPVYKKTGKLAFMRSDDNNEFWGPLLEKAFAKLNGSYKALEGGFTFQALQDLTGGFTEIFRLSLPEIIRMKLAKDVSGVFDLMVYVHKHFSFMGSSVKAHTTKKEKKLANGLVAGHAYSITDLRRLPIKDGSGRCIELLRLRNPWGNAVEWNGDFSDNCPKWDEYFEPELRVDLGVTYRADGEFWMTVSDYMEQFDRIEVCHVFTYDVLPDSTHVPRFGEYVVHSRDGLWSMGATAGGPLLIQISQSDGSPLGEINSAYETNPQYLLSIEGKDESEQNVFVCLMKNDRKAEGPCAIKRFTVDLFDISKLDPKTMPVPLNTEFFEEEENDPIEKFSPPGGAREVTIRYSLRPGKYVIIPSTDEPNCCGTFLLRVVTRPENKFSVFDKSLHHAEEDIDVNENTEEELAEMKQYETFFSEIADEDAQVDWWELKMLLDKTFHKEFHYEAFGFCEDECRSLVAVYDSDFSGRLDFYEFMKLWLNIKKWKRIFDKHAQSQSDTAPTIRTPNLGMAFAEAGYSVSKQVMSRIILRYGDRKGHLSLGKFLAGALKLESTFCQFKKTDIDKHNEIKINLENWLSWSMYA